MISSIKICGISDPNTLNYILNHPHPPSLIGFICNYKTSPRYVEFDKLKELLEINKKQSKYVAVIVKNDSVTLDNIKGLPFDYYQLYDCSPDETKKIKEKFKKKIITALKIKNKDDVIKYKDYENISDIILFDGPGMAESVGFNHDLLNVVPEHINKMIAGNIKIEDLSNFKNKSWILDVSGSLESEKGIKDINKIDKFLNTVHNISS